MIHSLNLEVFMASGVDIQNQSVVVNYRPDVVKVTVREGESVEAALERAGFSLTAPDPQVEWPIGNVFAAASEFGIDVNARIQGLIDLATLAPVRTASYGMNWLGRIKFS